MSVSRAERARRAREIADRCKEALDASKRAAKSAADELARYERSWTVCRMCGSAGSFVDGKVHVSCSKCWPNGWPSVPDAERLTTEVRPA